MSEILSNATYFGVTISLAGYAVGLWVKKKVRKPYANPLLISVILVILALVAMLMFLMIPLTIPTVRACLKEYRVDPDATAKDLREKKV